jgi:hypothetical protein
MVEEYLDGRQEVIDCGIEEEEALRTDLEEGVISRWR